MNGDHDLGVDLEHVGEQYNEKCGVFGVYVRTATPVAPRLRVVLARAFATLTMPLRVPECGAGSEHDLLRYGGAAASRTGGRRPGVSSAQQEWGARFQAAPRARPRH